MWDVRCQSEKQTQQSPMHHRPPVVNWSTLTVSTLMYEWIPLYTSVVAKVWSYATTPLLPCSHCNGAQADYIWAVDERGTNACGLFPTSQTRAETSQMTQCKMLPVTVGIHMKGLFFFFSAWHFPACIIDLKADRSLNVTSNELCGLSNKTGHPISRNITSPSFVWIAFFWAFFVSLLYPLLPPPILC